MRDACIRFLASKVNLKALDSETELMLIEEAGKVAALVGGEEFVLLVKLLNSLKVDCTFWRLLEQVRIYLAKCQCISFQ